MFWKSKNENNNINSREYEAISKRVVELSAKFEELQTKFKILETNYDNLRGNFNRKLSGIKKEEVVEETKTETNINISPFLSPNGEPLK